MPIITVYAEKGGVGKSVTAAGLARIYRHARPDDTIVVELDTQTHQHILLERAKLANGMHAFLNNPADYRCHPLISGGEEMLTVDYHFGRVGGFDAKLHALAGHHTVIVDTCPALKALRHGALEAADIVIVCARPELGIDEALDDYEVVINDFNRPALLVLAEYDKRSAAHRHAYEKATHVGIDNLYFVRRRLALKHIPPIWDTDVLDDYRLVTEAIEEILCK